VVGEEGERKKEKVKKRKEIKEDNALSVYF